MNSSNFKIILSAVIVAIVISLLFLVAPITETFVASYIFALISIAGIALALGTFEKTRITKVPQGYAFIKTAVSYAVLNVAFSIIACLVMLSLTWTILVHIAILAIFVIRTLVLTEGSEYINQVEEKAAEKHTAFLKEKGDYWE